MAQNSQRKRILIHAALIAALGMAVYFNSLKGQFVWDDNAFIKDNDYVQQWRYLPDLFTKNIIGSGTGKAYSFYRPLQMISFMADYSLWRLKPAGYHLTNILLHILTALCVYWLLYLLFKNTTAPFIAGILFAVHPVHTSAVASISGRADPLAGVFFLTAVILYIKNARQRSGLLSTLMIFAYAAALFSRENTLVLPFVILLYSYSFRQMIDWRLFIPLAALACIYVALRLFTINVFLPHAIITTPFFQRLPGFFAAISTYMRILILPFGLHMIYGNDIFRWNDPRVLFGITFAALALLSAFRAKRQNEIFFFAILWFFLTLLPQSNLYPLAAYMAEHWLYLPSIGFCIVLACGAAYLMTKGGSRLWVILFTTVIAIFYSSLTVMQNRYWQDPERFYKKTLEYVPNNEWMYNNLGNVYYYSGKMNEAISAYEKALSIKPGLESACYNLAKAYNASGRKEEAILLLNKAIEANPHYAHAYNNLGVIYQQMGDMSKAEAAYQRALEIKPDYADCHFNLGNVYYLEKEYNKAIEEFREAIRINPGHANAWHNIGLAYGALGKRAEEVESLERAVEIDNQRTEAYLNLGNIFHAQGEYDKAVVSYKRVLAIDGTNAAAYNNLGIAYRDMGNCDEALKAFKRAVKLKPDLADAYDNLGVEYARIGKDKEAIESLLKAIELNPGFANAYCNLATVYLKMNKTGEAVESYNKAIEIDPTLAVAYKNLSVIYLGQGRDEEAIKSCDKAVALGCKVEPEFLEKINQRR